MEIRFDSRTRKPKVYSLGILTIVTVLLLILLLRDDTSPERLKWSSILLSVHFLLSVIILLDAFRKQLEYNLYSYNTIIYSGFAIFFTYVAITYIYISVRSFGNASPYSAHEILFTLLNSAKNYLTLTAPFLLVFSTALFISNIALIRHEGLRFVNVLGMILAVLIVGGEVLLYAAHRIITAAGEKLFLRDLFINLFAAIYLYFECMLTGAIIAQVIAALRKADPVREILIVLGCGLMDDGTPTPLLRGRLSLAEQFYEEQQKQTGASARFLVSGGQGPDEVQSEAASMKAWLTGQGIPETAVLTEDRSADTAENMRFSKQIIDREAPDARVAFFTTNYHVFRAGLKARRIKMKASGMGAPTKWYFWPNAGVREFVGLLTEHKLKQGMVFFAQAAVYTALTILTYR